MEVQVGKPTLGMEASGVLHRLLSFLKGLLSRFHVSSGQCSTMHSERIPKVGLGFCNLHQRSMLIQTWVPVGFWIPPGAWLYEQQSKSWIGGPHLGWASICGGHYGPVLQSSRQIHVLLSFSGTLNGAHMAFFRSEYGLVTCL